VIVVVGLSHKTAPIEVRERVALDADGAAQLLRALLEQPAIGEALAVSTCNRMELVLAPRAGAGDLGEVEQQAKALLNARAPGVAAHLYQHAGSDALRHLFRVAASLDSLVLGEPQILGQVKQAFELAKNCGTVGAVLNRAVTQAIRVSKKVRSETAIGTGQVSVPSVALDLAEQIFGALRGKEAVLIGSGEMGETVARLIHQAGGQLVVVGRNAERVAELAQSLSGTARNLDELDQTLLTADVVIAATSAPGFVVTHQAVQQAMKKRRGRSLFFVDLAVPRDVDPGIAEIDNAYLYNVDDFSQIAAQGTLLRQREAQAADALIEREVGRFERTTSAEQVTPTVVALRRSFRAALEAELERSQRGKLKNLSAADLEALNTLFDAAVNKLLHTPTQKLRQLASEDPPAPELENYVELLSEMFALGDENSGVSHSGVSLRGSIPPAPSSAPQQAKPSQPSQGQPSQALPEIERQRGSR
jgi:glutamyl-tRNA reductase